MEIKVKIINHLEPATGKSPKGTWTKQDVLTETIETFPKKLVIGFWNDQATEIQKVGSGSLLTCHINVESREYNGKWYSDIKCWKFEAESKGTVEQVAAEIESDNIGKPDSLPF
jgi:hypothetical protein